MSVASASLYRGSATWTGLQNCIVIHCQSIPSLLKRYPEPHGQVTAYNRSPVH